MLHDMVNDILATEGLTEQQQKEQIQRAIWMVMAANHPEMKAGVNYGGEGLHDHRFMADTPGMGLMPDSEDPSMHSHSEQKPLNSPMNPANTDDHSDHDHSIHDPANHP